MATYIQRGETLDYLNTTGGTIKLGDIVKLGTRAGVAGDDIPAGEIGAVHVTGVYEMPKAASEALAVGDTLYLNAAGAATKTKAELTVVLGYAVAAAQAADATCRVRLCD